jgi:hypothetical protein
MELGTRPSHSKTMYDYKPCGRFVETIFPVVSIFRDYSFRTCGNIQNSQHEAELVGMGSNPRSANYTTAIETGLSAKHFTCPQTTDLPSVTKTYTYFDSNFRFILDNAGSPCLYCVRLVSNEISRAGLLFWSLHDWVFLSVQNIRRQEASCSLRLAHPT